MSDDDGCTVQDDRVAWDRTVKALHELAIFRITIGVHGDAKARDGGPGLTNAKLAAIHEFGGTFTHPGGTPYKIVAGKAFFVAKGTPGATGVTKPHTITIPARSFLRGAVDENVDQLSTLIAKQIDQIADGKQTGRGAAEIIGIYMQGLVQKRISDGIAPANKAATIKRKGSSKPLVDTGELKASIVWKISMKA
jgi:phage gpG-like protein